MSEPSVEFETPLPGCKVPEGKATRLIRDFVKKFRTADPSAVPSNLPTACLLKGREDKRYLHEPRFLQRKRLLFLLESAGILREVTPTDIMEYLEAREPWEDYDICLFDESLDWSVGITHNGDVLVVD